MVETKERKLANKVKKLRAERNMTQEELAQKSGVSLCAIVYIETCRKFPRMCTLMKLANALQVDQEELLQYVY